MSRGPTAFEPLVERIESQAALDRPGKALGKRVRGAVKPAAMKEALSGTWLGHALHPLLTDVVIGSFLSATLLDILGGDDGGRAQRRLVATGIVAAAPTVLTGANDWADTEIADDRVRRVGLVHATTNVVAVSLYAASLRGDGGRLLRLGGASALMVSGYLGGDLSFAKGVGVNETVYDPGPTEWTAVGEVPQLAEGQSARVVADETPVLVVRKGEGFVAIHDRCSHRGCSLADGQIDGDVVQCICHGSRFSLADGTVERGPASAPQPAFETRVEGGRLLVRRRPTGG